jgi:glycosyltransferase involved in cell wall biosynthesis
MPQVSVIIPTHNRAEFLSAAVTSVLHQTFQDFDIWIIDDASQDATQEVIAGFTDPRIHCIQNPSSQGDAGARNVGIRNSTGAYIAFLDDDDTWAPEKLQLQVKMLEASPAHVGGVCTGHYALDSASKNIVGVSHPTQNDLAKANFIMTSSLLVRRACFTQYGVFDEQMPTSSDYDMWIRIAQGFSFTMLTMPLVTYALHDKRLTCNYEKMIAGKERLFAKHDAFFRRHRKAYSREYRALGVLYCYKGDVHNGKRALLSALRMNPLDIRNYFNFALALCGAERFQQLKAAKEKVVNQATVRLWAE